MTWKGVLPYSNFEKFHLYAKSMPWQMPSIGAPPNESNLLLQRKKKGIRKNQGKKEIKQMPN